MTQIVQGNTVNVAGLIVPDAIIQIISPGTRPIAGVSTNVLGLVGGATWGPTNSPQPIGSNDQQAATFGPIQNVASDLGTAVWIGLQQGTPAIVAVRVTDGSDTAATKVIQDASTATALTVTGKYTGTLGNGINFTLSAGSAPSSTRAVVAAPGLPSETFDSITGGVVLNTVVPGTLYLSVPQIAFSAPQLAGGIQAQGAIDLRVYGTPTIGVGGTGYAVGDFITLSNGIVVKVASITGGPPGPVVTLAVISTTGCSPGSLVSGATPTNPLAQISTTGSGTGCTVNVTWGLGVVTMTQPGTGYTSATCTVTGGGGGTGGTVTVGTAVWQNLANAINLGQSGVRGPSNIVVATAASAVGAVVNATSVLAGGADGTANITSTTLIGVDTVPRKGMYALRSQRTSVFALADMSDLTKFSTMNAFALSEGTFAYASTAVGDTIAAAATEMATAGVDSYGFKAMFGDWVYWLDTVNSVTRLIAPATFAAGLRAATTPQNSTLNLPAQGVVGTQKSATGAAYSNADKATLINARMDVICNPVAGGAYYGILSGNNSSSNTAVNGENYTMMTNFLAKSVAAWAGGNIGLLQNPAQRRKAKNSLDNFFNSLATANPPIIGNADGTQCWQVSLNSSNNPVGQVTQGIEVAAVRVTYLSVIRWFIVNLIGGQTVVINTQQNQPPAFS